MEGGWEGDEGLLRFKQAEERERGGLRRDWKRERENFSYSLMRGGWGQEVYFMRSLGLPVFLIDLSSLRINASSASSLENKRAFLRSCREERS